MLKRCVVIIGSTGVGKSKLGVDIAKALNGEIINADAIQMYIGQDIATAKISADDQQSVPHHLMSFLDPTRQFTVREFRDRALPLIEEISSRGKTPVIVGGTLYYIQSLLWPSLLDENNNYPPPILQTVSVDEAVSKSGKSAYEFLVSVDPIMASQLHPNDDRKIHRSIEVYLEHGKKHSELINNQKSEDVKLPCFILWLTCERSVHHARLARRVDDMVENGLWEEARQFIEQFDLSSASEEQLESAAFQTIGYKEFLPFYNNKETMVECIEKLKIHHRQYAKKQLKWIRNRVLTKKVPVFDIDTTGADVQEVWDAEVKDRGLQICKWYLKNGFETDPLGFIRANVDKKQEARVKMDCDVCGISVVGKSMWDIHVASRHHRKRQMVHSRKETDSKKPKHDTNASSED